ncbi:MAG TPA: 50S ribosomal protein L23 [Ignavibacteriales bacterium]|nr:50S ribosomal protein L23 [Ignavibacteriales bacterium]HEX3075195.1 50S ribosomal protein L23 [Ignavibacteriales bacterium]
MKSIIKEPLITEKMTNITEEQNKYGFIVDINANKIEIAKEIEKRFNVKVTDVNTIKYKGKRKVQFRKSGRFEGNTGKFKKAVITLAKDQKIEILEQA